jgi:aspartate aminotransferase
MNARANELRAKGVDVYAFGVGEPDFEPPRFVLDAAKKAIDDGASKYTAVTGIVPLRQAICARTARVRGYEPKPDQVIVSVGAKHALFNLAVALYEPGDEVIIPAPYWVTYPEQVVMMGATPIIVQTDEAHGWKLTPEKLQSAITAKTKAIILCTPCNPTGIAYSPDEMKGLLEVVRKTDAWFIVDEIYAELIYDGRHHASALALAPDLSDRVITVDGLAKSYAMTGWRIGWAIAPAPIIKAMDLVQGQSTTNATAVAQYAAVAALNGPQDEVLAMRVAFERRRDVMITGLNSLPGVKCRKPEGAFYAFADVRGLYGMQHGERTIENDADVALFLLDRAHVASVPGSGFGAPGYVRFSYATSEARIGAGIASIAAAIASARRS